jgi:hypothetical protein
VNAPARAKDPNATLDYRDSGSDPRFGLDARRDVISERRFRIEPRRRVIAWRGRGP